MKKVIHNILFFFVINPMIFCYGQTVISHSVPEEFISQQYHVSVNGQSIPVFHAGLNVYFARFDFTDKIDVKVIASKITGTKSTDTMYGGQVYFQSEKSLEGAKFWLDNASVKPSSRNIKVTTKGAEVSFQLTEPGQYTVERPGTANYKDQVLFLFANKPETYKPDESDKNVIYLKKGLHHRNIDLKNNQTLYLEAGAVLYGAINVWNAKNVKILGRGTVVYCGPQSEANWYAAELNNLKNWHSLTTHNTQGLLVSGVTFIGKSRVFTIRLHSTFDAVFDNIKVLGINPANVNGDGFDWQGGGRTKIINSLVRCADDCFAFFPYDPLEELPKGATPTAEQIARSRETKDVTIENCVLWSTIANIFRVGGGIGGLRTSDIRLRDCDIIHHGRGEWLAPWSIICSVAPEKIEKSIHSNYVLENLRFEEGLAFLGIQNEDILFNNIIFKNISMTGNVVPSLVKCEINGLSFENINVNGKLIHSKEDVPFDPESKEIRNLSFK
jgi:hypothetical protein